MAKSLGHWIRLAKLLGFKEFGCETKQGNTVFFITDMTYIIYTESI